MADVLTRLTAALAERYAIERELGAGGMATVYLAEDLKHGRPVAVKVLRPELAAALGSERFLREIRVTAHLQHPNILTLIDSGDAEGFLYYVMPYVEGESLRARLQREKQLPLDDTLQITREVADGLDYAHGEGFVHRDIKPENILLSRGHAVVADFGIALGVSAAGGERLTETGLSLGTPEYMSPEQATGESNLDGRSDTYSLGCVVYEMLVGEPPFTGTTAQALMARHSLDPVPSMRTVRGSIPEHVEEAVGRALEKIPADRFTTSGRLVAALAQPGLAVTRSDARKGQGSKRFGTLPQLTAAALVVGLIVFLTLQVRQQDRVSPTPIHTQLTFTGDVWLTAISPDGQSIAYSSFAPDPSREAPLMVQDVGGGQAVPVYTIDPPTVLQWSPDGAELLFDTRASGQGDTYVAPRLGGTARRLITDWQPRWSPDGSQIASFPSSYSRGFSGPAKQITLTDTQTGDTTSIPLDGPFDLVMAGDWSPSGQVIAIVTATGGQAGTALWTATADGGRQQLVFEDSLVIVSPRWSPRGDAIYYLRASLGGVSGGTEELVKIPMSEATGAAQGPPETLLSGLQITQYNRQLSPISVSADGGRLMYSREAQHANLWLATVGEAGAEVTIEQLTTGTALIQNFAVSPDGATVVYARLGATGSDLFAQSLEGGPFPSPPLTVVTSLSNGGDRRTRGCGCFPPKILRGGSSAAVTSTPSGGPTMGSSCMPRKGSARRFTRFP